MNWTEEQELKRSFTALVQMHMAWVVRREGRRILLGRRELKQQ